MFLVQHDPRLISFFQHVLDWSSHMQMNVNLFKGSFRSIGGGYIHDAASTEDLGPTKAFFQASLITGISNVNICSAKQINESALYAGQTLSSRAPSK